MKTEKEILPCPAIAEIQAIAENNGWNVKFEPDEDLDILEVSEYARAFVVVCHREKSRLAIHQVSFSTPVTKAAFLTAISGKAEKRKLLSDLYI